MKEILNYLRHFILADEITKGPIEKALNRINKLKTKNDKENKQLILQITLVYLKRKLPINYKRE